jgi:hypothetical protein
LNRNEKHTSTHTRTHAQIIRDLRACSTQLTRTHKDINTHNQRRNSNTYKRSILTPPSFFTPPQHASRSDRATTAITSKKKKCDRKKERASKQKATRLAHTGGPHVSTLMYVRLRRLAHRKRKKERKKEEPHNVCAPFQMYASLPCTVARPG